MEVERINVPARIEALADQLQELNRTTRGIPYPKQKATESEPNRQSNADVKHTESLTETPVLLDKLPEPYQTPVRLYYEHHTVSAIAAQLERPKGTVKSLLSRGKKMLDKMIKQKAAEGELIEQYNVETEHDTLRAEVAARVGELPERYQQPMYLKYVENRTYPEIAEQLNCPEGTVKSLVSRGKKMLFGKQSA